MPDALTDATFRPHVGGTVHLDDGRSLTLVSIDAPDERQRDSAQRPPFTLLLRGEPNAVIAEGLHLLAFGDGTVHALYMIPIHTPSRDHQDYQIVFN
jgi:hypothetical protein